VAAIEHGEHVADRALHPERHAREAALAQDGQRLRGDVLGVGLGRHLGAGLEVEAGADLVEDRREIAGRQQRRRPAAEEDAAHGPVAERRSRQPDLGARHGREALPRARSDHVGVEVAVAAA
jgi:hypothetical protein